MLPKLSRHDLEQDRDARSNAAWSAACQPSFQLSDTMHTKKLLALIIAASLPAALVLTTGAGAFALQRLAASAGSLSNRWQFSSIEQVAELGTSATLSNFSAGLVFIVPLLIVSILTAIGWEIVFSRSRRRAVDPSWPMSAWLYTFLIPYDTPLILAAVGLSFGLVFGQHVFGGTGRYIVSPAVLGALVLQVSYPQLVPDVQAVSAVIADSSKELSQSATPDIMHGIQLASDGLGLSLALASLAGAMLLCVIGAASARVLSGALAGLFLSVLLTDAAIEPQLHFVSGLFAFCWAFVLTDPSLLPSTRPARWLYGALFAVLTVLIRETDPTHPEATLYAALLASLTVPILDYLAIRLHVYKTAGQLVLRS